MTLNRLINWVVLGVGGTAAEFALLKLLVDVLVWPLPIATLVAAEALILGKFVVADRWVFGHPRPTLERLLKYQGACVGALAVSWLVINGLVALLGLAYEVAFLVGTAASFAWSLLTNFFWVWAHPARVASSEKASGIPEHKDATSAIGHHQ